ncbi:helix-turn-helix domain-containing protein [Escherichia coli]|uniref:helix-turn-helix domain-containing protein n=1 Tax=Escherichia coli TaxID=562 RepID=UPI003B7C66FF
MLINTPEKMNKRINEINELNIDDMRRIKSEKKNDGNFTQVTDHGWERVRELLNEKQGSSAVKLYTFLAQHLDPSCGAVLADQQLLADKLNVSTRTIIRWASYLEEKGALVKIPVAGKVYAYALDPNEVWKGYKTSKPYAAFVTKALVNKDGEIQRKLKAMFSVKDKNSHDA